MTKFKDSFPDEKTRDWEGIWIGIHCFFSRNNWVTVLGDPLSKTGYNQWQINEPNNGSRRGPENCGNLLPGGKLNDLFCDFEMPFICEFKEPPK